MSYGAVAGVFFILSAMALELFFIRSDVRWRTVSLWLYVIGVITGAAGAVWAFLR